MARGLYDFFARKGHQIEILSDLCTKDFYQSVFKTAHICSEFPQALIRALYFNPDVFFTYHLHHNSLDPLSPLIAKILKRPYFIYDALSSKGHYQILNQLSLKSADHIFTDKIEGHPHRLKSLLKEKITYIPPSLDLGLYEKIDPQRYKLRQTLHIPQNEVVISSVAMLRPKTKIESIQFLIECLSDLRKEGINFTYIHAGGGKGLKKITSLAEKQLQNKFHILGTLNSHEVRTVFGESDIFAFPGLNEEFGIVYLEAQASQLPVVTFNNRGISDSISKDKSAFATPLMDKRQYKNALRKLIMDPDLRMRMGHEGLKYIKEKHNRLKNYELILENINNHTYFDRASSGKASLGNK